jgi:hypothetical protein
MTDDRPLGCAVVDFDMNGGIMALTFKYRCVEEAVNGMYEECMRRLAGELWVSHSKEEIERSCKSP